jgi:hypothetical protein
MESENEGQPLNPHPAHHLPPVSPKPESDVPASQVAKNRSNFSVSNPKPNFEQNAPQEPA